MGAIGLVESVIIGAAGGSESSLFAEDLVEMYKNYCRLMGFRFKQLDF